MGLDSELACSHYKGRKLTFKEHHRSLRPQRPSEHLQGRTGISRNKRSENKKIQECMAQVITELKHQKNKDDLSSRAKPWEEIGARDQTEPSEDVMKLGVSQQKYIWYFLVVFHSWASHSTHWRISAEGLSCNCWLLCNSCDGNLHLQLCEK